MKTKMDEKGEIKMDLSSFEAFEMINGKIFVTISKNGVSFSQAAVVALGKPEYVIVMFDTPQKQMAIKVASKEEDNATPFLRKGKQNLGIRWNNSLLKEKISSMMNWNLTVHSYKIDGIYDGSSKALIFDFSKAKKN